MAEIRTLKLNLLADVDNFSRGLKTAENKTSGFNKSLSKFSKMAALSWGAAGTAVLAYGVQAVKAAADDERSQKRLANALKATTKATDKQVASTEDWITKQQFAYGFSDSQIRPALARLARSTKSVTEAQKLTSLAMDISAGTGKDLETVANALAKANDGQYGALKKLGISLGDNAKNAQELVKFNKQLAKSQDDAKSALDEYGPSSKEYQKALEKVAENQDKVNTLTQEGADWVGELSKEFGGNAAEQAGTYAGQLKILSERTSEFQESIGAKLLPKLSEMLKATMLVADGFGGKTGLAKRVGQASDALSAARDEKYDTSWERVGASLKMAADQVTALFKAINGPDGTKGTDSIKKIADALESVAESIQNIKDTWNSIPKPLKDFLGKGNNLAKNLVVPGAIRNLMKQKRGDRALGGPVSAGGSYLVGERGPEIFTPRSSGSIAANGSGGTTIIMNGVIDGESARRSIERLFQTSSRISGAPNFTGAIS